MPARLAKIPSTGADVILHICEVCKEYACFGEGVNLSAAFKASDKGNDTLVSELLGKWYCLQHNPEKKDDTIH